jgi:glycosyltransferase involved in cell wall biosynthesis
MSDSSAPRVSVVLPTHNRVQLLGRALESVLAQTLTNIEVLVIDNASTDGTTEYLSSLADPRLRVIRVNGKLGASAARNVALRQARGEFVSFQDDDDVWLPQKLATQLSVLERADETVGLCLCGYIRLTSNGPFDVYSPGHFDAIRFDKPQLLTGMSAIATPAWLVRRKALENAGGFDELMPARNDLELAIRLSDICKFMYVAEPLFIQDQRHETSMARNEVSGALAFRRMLLIHGHRWTNFPKALADMRLFVGRHEISVGNRAEGWRWLIRSLWLNPLQPRTIALLLLSLLGRGLVQRLRRRRRTVQWPRTLAG